MKLVRVSSPIFFANAGQIEDTFLEILSDARTHPTDPEHAVAALVIDLGCGGPSHPARRARSGRVPLMPTAPTAQRVPLHGLDRCGHA